MKNKSYFIKQKYVVELYDAFEFIRIKSFRRKLVDVAKYLYIPQINEKPCIIQDNNNNEDEYYLGQCNKQPINTVVKEINDYNEKEYEELIKKELDNMINLKSIEGIYAILEYSSNLSLEYFNKIFFILSEVIKEQYDEVVYETFDSLIVSINQVYIDDIYERINEFIERELDSDGEIDLLIKQSRFNELLKSVNKYKEVMYIPGKYENGYFENEIENNINFME